MDQELIRKWLNQQKIQRVICAQQHLMRNTMIPDIDNKYQINIAKLSNEKNKTVFSYAVHRNTKIGETIQNYIIQAQNRLNQKKRQIKPIRFRTQQTTRTDSSVERSYNICPQHSIYLNNRKSVRTSSVIGAIKTQQSNSQLIFIRKAQFLNQSLKETLYFLKQDILNKMNLLNMKKYDAIIIGGGHNALVAACYLKYKNILLLERRHITGGAAQTEEIYPGFKFSRFSYLLSLMRPSVINELNLYQHGLKLFRRPISSITVTKNKGEYLLMNSDSTFCKQEIAKFSKRDSEVYDEYNQFLSEIIDLWSYYQDKYPYDTSAKGKGYNIKKSFDDLGLLLKMGQDGLKNKDKIYDYIQFMSQSSSQFLNKWFESDILKGTLITDGIIGEMISIDTPASAYILLHHVMGEIFPNSKGEWAFVEGGMGSISKILTKLNEQKGVEIKTNIGVEQILTSNNQVTGVKCSDNNIYYSDTIISSVTPRITFEKLLSNDQQTKNPKYFNDVKHMEYNGACTKFNFAVSEMPKFKCFEGTKYEKPESVLIGTTHLGCERLDTLRQAYQDCINGKSFSDNLFVDLVVPTVHDKTIAPQGQHIVQCLVQYTPYKANWNEQIKQQLKEQVIDYISQYAPNFKNSILYTDMVTPQEIEQLLNMTEGNIFHGALTLDKLYGNRPSNGYNSYGTPINGLFLCGSGTHPGGGVMGAPGRNCALYINNYVK